MSEQHQDGSQPVDGGWGDWIAPAAGQGTGEQGGLQAMEQAVETVVHDVLTHLGLEHQDDGTDGAEQDADADAAQGRDGSDPDSALPSMADQIMDQEWADELQSTADAVDRAADSMAVAASSDDVDYEYE